MQLITNRLDLLTQKSSHEVLEAKLSLERALTRQMTPFFRSYFADVQMAAGKRRVVHSDPYIEKLEALFIRHYARVSRTFRDGEFKAARDIDLLAASVVDASQVDPLLRRAKAQARFVIGTIENDIRDGHEAKDLRGLTVGMVTSMRRAKRRLKNRIPMISNMQTQELAEDTRRLVVTDEGGEGIKKIWSSLMDGRERPAHHVTHLAYHDFPIRVDQFFNVGGESMLMPGDTRHGASLKNVINCRCAAIYYRASQCQGGPCTGSPIASTPRAEARPQRVPGARVGPVTKPTQSMRALSDRTGVAHDAYVKQEQVVSWLIIDARAASDVLRQARKIFENAVKPWQAFEKATHKAKRRYIAKVAELRKAKQNLQGFTKRLNGLRVEINVAQQHGTRKDVRTLQREMQQWLSNRNIWRRKVRDLKAQADEAKRGWKNLRVEADRLRKIAIEHRETMLEAQRKYDAVQRKLDAAHQQMRKLKATYDGLIDQLDAVTAPQN